MPKSKPARYLRTIGGYYYFRIAIPRKLQIQLKSKEVLKSLRTTNYREAILKSLLLESRAKEIFRKMTTGEEKPEGLSKFCLHEVSGDGYHINFGGDKCPNAAKLELEAYKAHLAQQSGAGLQQRTKDQPDLHLSVLIPLYLKDSRHDWTDAKDTTYKRHKRELDVFKTIVDDKDVNFIDEDDCLKYHQIMKKWPRDYKSDRHGDLTQYMLSHPDAPTAALTSAHP